MDVIEHKGASKTYPLLIIAKERGRLPKGKIFSSLGSSTRDNPSLVGDIHPTIASITSSVWVNLPDKVGLVLK